MARMRREDGFSLIELVSVILLLGILSATVLPMFDTSGIDASTAAATVQTDIRFVQELALARNPANVGDVGIIFTQGQSSYTITDPAGIFSLTRDLPNNVVISQAPPTSGNLISFNKYGEPEIGSTDVSFQISTGGEIKTITVEHFTGRVTVS
ncbi:MAG: hypothetical protein COV67_00665 [Nitrospinae bacterium CG11_big_fil_rev_8_21_14_0_20_56_8]|nr:MAG: hypothetical protein COV67_00665 [Nitrospinae bacterium CG11_big_fil_rev_8_21_14_0_20_56_8]